MEDRFVYQHFWKTWWNRPPVRCWSLNPMGAPGMWDMQPILSFAFPYRGVVMVLLAHCVLGSECECQWCVQNHTTLSPEYISTSGACVSPQNFHDGDHRRTGKQTLHFPKAARMSLWDTDDTACYFNLTAWPWSPVRYEVCHRVVQLVSHASHVYLLITGSVRTYSKALSMKSLEGTTMVLILFETADGKHAPRARFKASLNSTLTETLTL